MSLHLSPDYSANGLLSIEHIGLEVIEEETDRRPLQTITLSWRYQKEIFISRKLTRGYNHPLTHTSTPPPPPTLSTATPVAQVKS